jgi:hypothetical protein
MAGAGRSKRGKRETAAPATSEAESSPTGIAGLPLPSPVASTNLVIADIVFRAAGGLLRDRMEKGLLIKSYDKSKAERLVDGRGLATSVALWGASHLARRSPLGLAVVAGGLAAKVFYDRGRRLEKRRQSKKPASPPES